MISCIHADLGKKLIKFPSLFLIQPVGLGKLILISIFRNIHQQLNHLYRDCNRVHPIGQPQAPPRFSHQNWNRALHPERDYLFTDDRLASYSRYILFTVVLFLCFRLDTYLTLSVHLWQRFYTQGNSRGSRWIPIKTPSYQLAFWFCWFNNSFYCFIKQFC
jgi:hypothetical protein